MSPVEYTGPGTYTQDAPVLAWHLGSPAPTIHTEDAPAVISAYRGDVYRPGDTVTADQPLQLCKSGPHASIRASDCLTYGHGPILSRVACWGEIIGDARDKIAAQHRTHLTMIDLTPHLAPMQRELQQSRLIEADRTTADETEMALWRIVDAYAAEPEKYQATAERAYELSREATSYRYGATNPRDYLYTLLAPGRPTIALLRSFEPDKLQTLFETLTT